MWSCQHCTLHNEPHASVCSLCGNTKPREATGWKGKGRVLRPRGPNGAVNSTMGEGSSSDEDMEEEDFASPLTDKQVATRRARSRSLRPGKEGNPGDSCGEGHDRVTRRENTTSVHGAVSFQTAGASGDARISPSGRQHQPVELDGTDGSDTDCYLAGGRSGGDIHLFGRGWRNRTRHGGQSMMARRRDQGSPVRRGTKRQRPAPSTPSETEITLWGVHACGASASEDECRPLVPPPRRQRIEAADPALWKWPPRVRWRVDAPSSASTCNGCAGDASQAPKAEACISAPNKSTRPSDPSLEGEKKGDDEVLSAAKDVDGSRSLGGKPSSGEAGGLPTRAAPEGPSGAAGNLKQPPGKKNQRRRSRLSLPRRANDERANGSPQASSPVQAESPAETVKSSSPRVVEPVVETPTKSNPEAESRGDEREDDEDDSPNAMETCSMDDSEDGKRLWSVGLLPGGRKPREVETPNRVAEGPLAEGPPNEATPSVASGKQTVPVAGEGSTSNAGSCSGNNVAKETPADVETQELPKTVAQSVPSSNSRSARAPRRRGMLMEMDEDSDSDSEDEETQAPPKGEAAASFGSAQDGKGSPPSSGPRSTQPDAAPKLPKPLSTPLEPATSNGNGNTEMGSPPGPTTSTPTGDDERVDVNVSPDESRPAREESPEPSMTGLIDTPSPPARSPPADEKLADRKLAVSNKRSESSASAPVLFRRTRSKEREPASRSSIRRGEWSCEQCTLLNRARAKFCCACEAPKPSKSHKGAASAADGGPASKAKRDNSRGLNARQENTVVEEGASGTKGGNGIQSPEAREDLASNDSRSKHDETDGELCKKEAPEAENVFNADIETISSDGDMSDEDVAQEEDSQDDDDDDDYDDDDWNDCEDEDYEQDGDDDEEDGDYEMERQNFTSSQIEKICLHERCTRGRASPTKSPASKRRRKAEHPTGEVLDLTDIADDAVEAVEQPRIKGGSSASTAANPLDENLMIEDISDDDEDECKVSLGHPTNGATRSGAKASDCEMRTGAESRSTPRKFRFFASVKEHRDSGTSCVDFARLEAAQSTSEAYTKSYEARRKAREAKEGRSKRGKGARSSRATGAKRSGRKNGTSARSVASAAKSPGRRVNGASGARKATGQALGTASGLTSGWIPAGVRDASGSSGASGRASSGKPSAGVARQPFNHYQRSDEVVEAFDGTGGLHWEHAGRSTFGD